MQLRGEHTEKTSQYFLSAFHTHGQCEFRETSIHTNILISLAPLNHARERESATFLGHAQ